MTIAGIVAEYNPFHNGHLHLIAETKKNHDISAIICVMSGPFLQRGDTALCDKWSRAEMAVRCGVDLVIELPFCFASRSAYYFARGALLLLARSGVVTHLTFGSENGNIEELRSIARLLIDESDHFKTRIKGYLAQGLSFPSARARAIGDVLPREKEPLQNTLSQPNNILGIEYLRVIAKENLPLIPVTIKRTSLYHSSCLDSMASAAAIRSGLYNGVSLLDIANAMPPASFQVLQKEIDLGKAPVYTPALEQAIMYQLRSMPVHELEQIYEMGEGLHNRFKEAADATTSLEELRQRVKSKRYSLTRINRILLYTLLSLTKNQICYFDQVGPLYMHILGFSVKGREILQKIKNISLLPLLSRGSQVKAAWDGHYGSDIEKMIHYDVLANDIYSLLYPSPSHRHAKHDFIRAPYRE
ncbi:nucleotidyltransferase [Syntrophomonas erecta]